MTDAALDALIARTRRICGSDLDALIAQGWGDVNQPDIPADWRTRRGPDKGRSARAKQSISRGLDLRWLERRRAQRRESRRERLDRVAARMRGKYLTPMRIFSAQRIAKRWAKTV